VGTKRLHIGSTEERQLEMQKDRVAEPSKANVIPASLQATPACLKTQALTTGHKHCRREGASADSAHPCAPIQDGMEHASILFPHHTSCLRDVVLAFYNVLVGEVSRRNLVGVCFSALHARKKDHAKEKNSFLADSPTSSALGRNPWAGLGKLSLPMSWAAAFGVLLPSQV